MSLKRVAQKTFYDVINNFKNLLRFTPLRNGCLITEAQKQPPDVFYEKSALKNFAIFTGKRLYWRLFLNRNIVKFLGGPILKKICERLLLKLCS